MAKPKKKIDYKLIGLAALIIGSILLVFYLVFSSKTAPEQINEGQIRMDRGDKTVTVNRNGSVEYKSSDGTFYEFWDETRVSNFFAITEARAREYLASPQPKPGANAYKITLWLDGKIVTIYIEGDDQILEEIFEEFDDPGGDSGTGDVSDYFDDEDDEEDGSTGSTTSSPTPTTRVLPNGYTPTPTTASTGQGGGNETVQIPPDCDLYNQQVNQRTVISNTICDTGEE